MAQIFHVVFFQPLFNLFIFLYNIIPGHQFALAIIFLTIIVRIILHPFSLKAIANQRMMQDVQVKTDELKKRFKDDKEKMSQELLALYKREKVNPFSSCLPTLVQFPFLIAIFQVLRKGVTPETLQALYSFVSHPGAINFVSWGINLVKPSIILAILAGLAQFWQTKMLVTKMPPKEVIKDEGAKDESMSAIMNKQMMYMFPALIVFMGFSFPAGLTLYWLVSTLLTIVEQKYFLKAPEKSVSINK